MASSIDMPLITQTNSSPPIRPNGKPAEIYARPASRFVAEFIGDINILERDIKNGRELPDSAREAVMSAGAIATAVRPERIHNVPSCTFISMPPSLFPTKASGKPASPSFTSNATPASVEAKACAMRAFGYAERRLSSTV